MKRYTIISDVDIDNAWELLEQKNGYLCTYSEVSALLDVAKKALNYYADEKTWEITENSLSHLNIDFDCGTKAREALERMKAMEDDR
jgi:hypothetical protein